MCEAGQYDIYKEKTLNGDKIILTTLVKLRMSKLVTGARASPAAATSRHLLQELEIYFRFTNTDYTGPASIAEQSKEMQEVEI